MPQALRAPLPGGSGTSGPHDPLGVAHDEAEGIATLIVLGETFRGAVGRGEPPERVLQRPRTAWIGRERLDQLARAIERQPDAGGNPARATADLRVDCQCAAGG